MGYRIQREGNHLSDLLSQRSIFSETSCLDARKKSIKGIDRARSSSVYSTRRAGRPAIVYIQSEIIFISLSLRGWLRKVHTSEIEYRRTLHQDSVGILRQRTTPSLPATKRVSIARFPGAFLTGSASQTECDVTHTKQTTGTFLTVARTALKPFRFSRNFGAESFAPAAKSPAQSRPRGRS